MNPIKSLVYFGVFQLWTQRRARRALLTVKVQQNYSNLHKLPFFGQRIPRNKILGPRIKLAKIVSQL